MPFWRKMMTNRMKLLAAVAAAALPTAMAFAQSPAPGGGAPRAGTTHPATHSSRAPAATPATPPATANTGTEDAQATNAQAAETPVTPNQNAETNTQADSTTR